MCPSLALRPHGSGFLTSLGLQIPLSIRGKTSSPTNKNLTEKIATQKSDFPKDCIPLRRRRVSARCECNRRACRLRSIGKHHASRSCQPSMEGGGHGGRPSCAYSTFASGLTRYPGSGSGRSTRAELGRGCACCGGAGGDEAPPSHVSRPPTDGDSTRTRNGLSFDPGLWHTNPIPAPPPAVTAVSPRLPETEAPCAADARGLQ